MLVDEVQSQVEGGERPILAQRLGQRVRAATADGIVEQREMLRNRATRTHGRCYGTARRSAPRTMGPCTCSC